MSASQSLSRFATAFGYLGVELGPEPLQRLARVGAGGRLGQLVQQRLGARLQPLRERAEHVGCLVHAAALLSRAGEHAAQRRPRSERPVTGHELWLVHPAVAQIAEYRRPRVLGLAVAVLDREQLLLPGLADADHHQQAQLEILAEPDADVDAVDEQVGVTVEPQLPGPERGVLCLPGLGQPLDRAGRQPQGVLAE